jgi:hypothetical protein
LSRIEIPVRHQVIRATGDIRLWANVDLLLKTAAGGFAPARFRIDTATDITTFPAYDAKTAGLPMPQAPSPVTHLQTGLEVRSGILRFRISGMDQTEYATTCLFLGDPDTPPDPAQAAMLPRKLLQPLGLLDHLKFTADRDPTNPSTPYRTITIEKK